MSSYTVIVTCERLGIDIHKNMIKVSKNASGVDGTSADLSEGDELTIW